MYTVRGHADIDLFQHVRSFRAGPPFLGTKFTTVCRNVAMRKPKAWKFGLNIGTGKA